MNKQFLLLCLGMLAAFPARAAEPEGKPAMLKDAKTGCLVQVGWLLPNQKVSWSGPCVKGRAQGEGTMRSSAVEKITGEYREGKAYNAQGTTAFRNNAGASQMVRVSYKEGRAFLHTQIAVSEQDPASKCALFDFNSKPPHGVSWSGKCVGGFASGQGKAAWTEKGAFLASEEGEFQDGIWLAKGTITLADGRTFTGEYRNGDFFGTLALRDGSRYEGQFRDLKPFNAKGTLARPDAAGATSVVYKEGVASPGPANAGGAPKAE